MDDCTTTFDMENIIPCIPAGIPILSIRLNSTLWIFILSKCSLYGSFSLRNSLIIKVALTALAIPVATATPATPIWKYITNNRFNMVFTMPAAIRIYRGRRVSPILRSMAAPKLYAIIKGIPKKYIRR